MNTWAYILVTALTAFLIRTLPLTLIRKPIRNTFFRSFLYYVPYVTLAVMTFPSMITAAGKLPDGIAAFALGIFLSCRRLGLLPTAVFCCLCVFLCSLL